MSDLAAARDGFLNRAEDWVPGQSRRLAPVLDDLIRWSEDRAGGLQFVHHAGSQPVIKFCVPGIDKPFWAAAARTRDGGKLSVLADRHRLFPDELRAEAHVELARIAGRAAGPGVPLAMLIWAPHRQSVLDLMARLLDGIHARREPARV